MTDSTPKTARHKMITSANTLMGPMRTVEGRRSIYSTPPSASGDADAPGKPPSNPGT